jgi:hypothetical protein
MIKVCGYVINEEALLLNGLKRGLGTVEDERHQADTILQSAMDIMARGGVLLHARFVGVLIKGKVHRCIALACNDPFDPLPMADRESIEMLKKVLHTDREPRWYTYA